MKKIFYYPCVFLLVMLCLQQGFGSCSVLSSNGRWYQFPNLCCCHFIINSSAGEMCVDNNDCENCPPNTGSRISNTTSPTYEETIGLLTRVTDYALHENADGTWVLTSGGLRLFTLTAEGGQDFRKTGEEFYLSSLTKVDISDGKIAPVTPKSKTTAYAIDMGKLTPEQEANVIRIGTTKFPASYLFVVETRDDARSIGVTFTAQATQTVKLEIMAINGTVVHLQDVPAVAGENKLSVDLSKQNPGHYYILLHLDGTVWNRQFSLP